MEGLFNVPNSKPIRDIVYEQLKDAISQGKIKQGERIIENDYAEKMNVSRTPVREALRKLEIEGFVEYLPRKGVVVKSFTIKDVIEIYDIRESLECLAIKYTIENITEPELEKLREAVADTEKAISKGDINGVFIACNEFNKTILNSCKMPRLSNMINTLQKYISGLRDVNMKDDFSRVDRALHEHINILKAIEEKDIKKAKQAVREHIESSRKTYLDKFGEKK